MGRRRCGTDYSRIAQCGIRDHCRTAFQLPFKNLVRQPVREHVLHLAVMGRSSILPLLNVLEEDAIKRLKLQLQPECKETNVGVTLHDGGDTKLNAEFIVSHPTIYGGRPYPGLNSPKGMISAFVSTIDGVPHLFGKPLGADAAESFNEILGHMKVIDRELPPWINQFDSVNDSTSVAAFYAAPVRHWLAQLRIDFTAYQRRPRTPYEVAMSPALNTSLTVALQLHKAKTDAENQASQA